MRMRTLRVRKVRIPGMTYGVELCAAFQLPPELRLPILQQRVGVGPDVHIQQLIHCRERLNQLHPAEIAEHCDQLRRWERWSYFVKEYVPW